MLKRKSFNINKVRKLHKDKIWLLITATIKQYLQKKKSETKMKADVKTAATINMWKM